MINSIKYDDLDAVALQLRLDYNCLEKRLDVFNLAKKLNIILIKYSILSNEQKKFFEKMKIRDGFTVFEVSKGGDCQTKIYYNDKLDKRRIRFTIAHEIKHIVFSEYNPTDEEEQMANHFARYILAPSCLIMEDLKLKIDTLKLSEIYEISFDAATNAYKAAEKRLKSSKRDLKDFEREFINEFSLKQIKNLRLRQ